MDRREAVKAVAVLMEGAFSTSTLSMMLDSCTTATKQSNGDDFSGNEKEIVERMCDIIIPRTDTPGAVDAGVPDFVLMMIQDCYTPENKKIFHNGLISFDKTCKEKSGASFLKLSGKKQLEAVQSIDTNALDKKNKKNTAEDLVFYRNLKALALLGFFTSEPGATKTLRYVQVPGKYEGCIPYHKQEKA